MSGAWESPATWATLSAKATTWTLLLSRLSGFMAGLPWLGSEAFPALVRLLVGALLALALMPAVPAAPSLPEGLWGGLAVVATELALGLLLGSGVAWILEAVALAGALMDMQMGFSFAQVLDPTTGQSGSLSGALLSQGAGLLIFTTGLHHAMLLALAESLRLAPLGQGLPLALPALLDTFARLMGQGLRLATPLLAVLFLLDLALALGGKFMPQLQLLQLGFPLKIALGLLVLGGLLRRFDAWLGPLLEAAPREALKLLAG